MLYTLVLILVMVWVFGLLAFPVLGSLIHVVLLVALGLMVFDFISARRPI